MCLDLEKISLMQNNLLGMNYRSTANIVQNSLKLIENNVERYSKKLEANREGGSCLHIQEVKDPVEEAEYVLEEIQKCKENGIKEEEIADSVQGSYRCASSGRSNGGAEDPVSDERTSSKYI